MTSREQAQQGLTTLKQAIQDYLSTNATGISSSEISHALGIDSDFEGKQKNYLCWSILGLLVNEGKVRYEKRGRFVYYFLSEVKK